ncbi:hypothetical protein BGZ76_001074 [Entomortierella beljakovae]|nr:hypothetical protein BGZ76_001074 [Entomortierella beljakovae]
MSTDDEASSTASFGKRSRKPSKSVPISSPLSTASSFSTFKNTSTNALSSLSFLSSGDRSNTNNSSKDLNKSSQLRVKHLEQNSTYAGYLTKFSSRTFFSRKQWKRRYFILSEKSLYCFKSSDPQHPLLEAITLSPDSVICVTDEFSGKRFCLEISCPGEKNWYVLADTAPEMSGWLKELKNTVHNIRNFQHDARPETFYSETSDVSDFSGISSQRIPSVPTIPSQYEFMNGTSKSLPGTLSSNSSLLARQIQQSSYEPTSLQQHQHHLDSYPMQAPSLSPPPRPITPKPSTLTPGSSPNNAQGTTHIHSFRAPSQLQPLNAQQNLPETRRRRNSSLSSVQPSPDYASFGAVMQRAEALAEAQSGNSSSSWTTPTKSEMGEGNYATLPRSKRESVMSTMSSSTVTSTTSSVTPRNQGAYVATERPDSVVSLQHRNVQRLSTFPSRPTSTIPSRPLSPAHSRSSPRNSLVITPPPRSSLRPSSVSIRHSTQILPLPQNATASLPHQQLSKDSVLSSSPPTSSLPATPNSIRNLTNSGSLSRITSMRTQRDPGLPGGINRHSMISTSSFSSSSFGTGSIQERVQRSSSRASVMASASSLNNGSYVKPATPSDILNINRPTSPTPSLSAAPTLPLPELPSSPTSPTRAVSPLSTFAPSINSVESLRRISSIPRHHEPDLPLPNRSKSRLRSQSQEAALLSTKLGGLQISQGANSPSPRLSAVLTPSKDYSLLNNTESNKQLSLPIHTMYALPAPPTGQVPAQPSNQVSSSSSRPLMQLSTGSGAALRPISSSMNNVPSLGGGIARRPSTTNSAITASTSKRDSYISPRLSALLPLPPGPSMTMPLPPSTSLPAPPTSALPSKPDDAPNMKEANKPKTSPTNGQTGFDVILEEEENDEGNNEDEEDEEAVSHLQFEELEAAKASTEQEQDPESTATTPTTATRPEYYATKESKIVEYIFPSESFAV